MTRFIRRGARALAVSAVAGVAAFGAAHATDWDQLKSNDWSGAESKGEVGTEATAPAADAGGNWGAEIATAFQGLGMEPARAECYGKVLVAQLSGDDLEEAAQIVRGAGNGEEVRAAVMNAGPELVGGFSAANTSCPEGTGG